MHLIFGKHLLHRRSKYPQVLLAEAGVPYDWVFEMDEVQDDAGAGDLNGSRHPVVQRLERGISGAESCGFSG